MNECAFEASFRSGLCSKKWLMSGFLTSVARYILEFLLGITYTMVTGWFIDYLLYLRFAE